MRCQTALLRCDDGRLQPSRAICRLDGRMESFVKIETHPEAQESVAIGSREGVGGGGSRGCGGIREAVVGCGLVQNNEDYYKNINFLPMCMCVCVCVQVCV